MRIEKLTVHKFRQFNEKTFLLGKYITAISGYNATGKSTLLALLGHCGELRGEKALLGNSFKANLNEIIKLSPEHDRRSTGRGSKVATLSLTDITNNSFPVEFSYRCTVQNARNEDTADRLRLIPVKTPRNGERKLVWPTLYLGLSRLYPVGESKSIKTELRLSRPLAEEDIAYIKEKISSILSDSDEYTNITPLGIDETSKKRSIGLNTAEYSYLTNSAGQDNLSQIITSVLSFKNLKERLGTDWHGGLLLIDEIDATLHPRAQIKLIQYLYREARNLEIQIIFTTHSLSLLEFIQKKTCFNTEENMNNYQLIFLSRANGPITVFHNPTYETIYCDLMSAYDSPDEWRKIRVFSEDNEARFFIENLLGPYMYKLKLIDINLGCDELLRLLKEDYDSFSRFIFILDGDVDQSSIDDVVSSVAIPGDILPCLLTLPGNLRPESVIWEYLMSLPAEHDLLNSTRGYTKRNFEEAGPKSDIYNSYTKERRKFKEWFKNNTALIQYSFPYWVRDNKNVVDNFIDNFIKTYNNVAELHHLPNIQKLT